MSEGKVRRHCPKCDPFAQCEGYPDVSEAYAAGRESVAGGLTVKHPAWCRCSEVAGQAVAQHCRNGRLVDGRVELQHGEDATECPGILPAVSPQAAGPRCDGDCEYARELRSRKTLEEMDKAAGVDVAGWLRERALEQRGFHTRTSVAHYLIGADVLERAADAWTREHPVRQRGEGAVLCNGHDVRMGSLVYCAKPAGHGECDLSRRPEPQGGGE